jgi:hypothetical protein
MGAGNRAKALRAARILSYRPAPEGGAARAGVVAPVAQEVVDVVPLQGASLSRWR